MSNRSARALAFAVVALLGTACGGGPTEDAAAAAGGGAESPAAAASAEPEYLYVASQSGPAVSMVDMNARTIVETIWLTELGFTANAKPHHVAVEADGSFWYVSLITDGRVLKFDADNELVGQAEFETPGMLSVDPVRDLLYVGRSMAAVNPPQRIGVITRSDMSIDEYDVFFPRPHALIAAPGGGRAFTASLSVNQFASVAPEDDEIDLVNIDGPMQMFVQFAVSPDGTTLATGGQMSGDVMIYDISDPAAPALTATIPVGGEPWHPVYSPDGGYLYYPQRTANAVAVIDTATWEVVGTIRGEGLVEPHGSAVSADGTTLWVSARNIEGSYPTTIARTTAMSGDPLPAGTVVAIDTATRQVVTVLEVPAYAAGVGTRPAR